MDVVGDRAVFEDATHPVVSWSSPSDLEQWSDHADKDSINQGPNIKRIKNMLFTETYPVVSSTSKFSFNSEKNRRERSVYREQKLSCISGNVSEVRKKFERSFMTPSNSSKQVAKLSSSDPNLLNAHQGNRTEHGRRTLSHSGESGMMQILGMNVNRNHKSSSSLSCLLSPALSESQTKVRINSGPISKRLSSFLLDVDVDEAQDENTSLLSSFAKTSSISLLKSDELALLKFSHSPLKGTDDATTLLPLSESKGEKRQNDGRCLKDLINPALPSSSPIESDVVFSNIATGILKAEFVMIESDSPRSDESMPINDDENGVECEALQEADNIGSQGHEEKEQCNDHPFDKEHIGIDLTDSESYESQGKEEIHSEEDEMITSWNNPLKGIENAAFEDQLVENPQSDAEESTEVFEARSVAADIDQYEILPGLSSDEERGSNRKVRFSSSPIKVFAMHSKEEYDRSNDEVDPIASSAEYELEKRVEQMVVFPVELNKDEHGLGISIIGMGVGVDTDVESLGIFVKSIIEGGAAHRDGRIKVNDQIVEVNGISLVGVTHLFASETLRNNSGQVRFLFGRDKPGQTSELARLLQTVQGEKRQEELLKARHLSHESDSENQRHRISQASSREDDEGTPADNGAGSVTEQTICDSASDEEVFRPLDLEPSQLSIQYQEVCTSEREWQAWDGERSLLSAALLEERSIAEDLHSHDEEAQEECQKLTQLLQEALAVKEDLGHRYQQLLTLLPQEAHGKRADLLEGDGVEGQEFNNCEKQQQQHESKMPVMNVTHSATVEQSSSDQLCGGGSTQHELCSANVIESPKVVDGDLFFGLIPQMMILDSSIQKAKRQLLGKNKRRKPSRTHSPLVMKQMLKASKEKNIVTRTGAMPKTKSSPPAQEIEMTTEEPSVESVQPSPRSALPAERSALPAERSALPAERCALLAERSALPAERSALPAERSALPAERSALPAERSALPAERSALPAERSALPAERCALLAERSALPAERSALPAERSALPAERSALPAERSALPAERCALLAEGSALPAERSALPAERSALPAERSALPAERCALLAERSALPAERSALPAERCALLAEGSALPAARERSSFGKGTRKFFRYPLRQSLGKGKKNNVHVSSSNKESQESTRNVSDWARERNGPRSNALSACMPWSRRNSDGGVDSDNGLSDGPLPRAGRPQTSLATGQISEAGRGEEVLYGMITEPNTTGYSHTFIVNNEVGQGYMEGLSPTRPHHWQNRAVHEWGPEQVNQWLLVLGLEQYAESFSLHDVHGDQLLQLDGSKLKALGVLDAEDRALIKRRLKDLRTALMKERKVQVKLERQRAKEHDLNKLATSDGSQDTMI